MTATELRDLRHQLGLTQAQLAEAVGLHSNTIARMERAEKRITHRTAVTLRLLASAQQPA